MISVKTTSSVVIKEGRKLPEGHSNSQIENKLTTKKKKTKRHITGHNIENLRLRNINNALTKYHAFSI